MTQVAWVVVAGLAAFGATMALGYRNWKRRLAVAAAFPDAAAQARGAGNLAVAPIIGGAGVGLCVVAIAARILAEGDRFHTAASMVSVSAGVVAGGFLLAYARFFYTLAALVRMRPWEGRIDKDKVRTLDRSIERRGRWVAFSAELVAAAIAVWAGVRFDIVGVGGERVYDLGQWGWMVTVAWILACTNIVKLLDGLEGAVNILLLAASAALCYAAVGSGENFLMAFTSVLIGVAAGSLRFNFLPARLPLRGSGSALMGFLFGVLTVLARRKAATMLLVVVPLAVVVILLGGAMLTLLERAMMPGDDGKR